MPRRLEKLNAKADENKLGGSNGFEENSLAGITSNIDWKNKKIFAGIIVIIAVAVLFLLFFYPPSAQNFELTVKDSKENPIEGVLVEYSINGNKAESSTNAQGKIIFFAEKNSQITVSIKAQKISGIDYAQTSETFFAANSFSGEIFLLAEEEKVGEKIIVFQNSSGARIAGRQIQIKLSCANKHRLVQETASDSDKDGIIKIVKPKECNILNARIIGPETFKQTTFTIANATTFVVLEQNAESAPKGKIRVRIVDSENRLVTEKSFTVQLVNAINIVVMEKKTQNFGAAFFTGIDFGAYRIVAFDTIGEYRIASAFAMLVSQAPEQEKTIEVTKKIKGTIKARAIGKNSGMPVENAVIQLYNPYNELIAEQTTGFGYEETVFSVSEEGAYKIIAMHEDFLPATASIETSGNITLELEECTAENCGIIEVKVIDEDLLPVENALVVLKNTAGETRPYAPKTTDANGTAFFNGVSVGEYYAFAEKFPANGQSQPMHVELNTKNFLLAQIEIGSATIRIIAEDTEGNPIEEATAEIFSENGKALQALTMPKGIGELQLKADKKIFVIVRASNYETIQTIAERLWPNGETRFEVKMSFASPRTSPEMRFEGIFQNNEKTGLLSAREKYVVVFSLFVPANNEFAKAGLHFRLGKEEKIENEQMAITDILAGNPKNILKGTTFSRQNDFEMDSASDNGTPAKWASIEFAPEQKEARKYFIGIEFKVNSNTMPGSALEMFYRAWFADTIGNYLRIPEDEELGKAESVPTKNGLYAQTIRLEFNEGSDADCESEICYENEWFFDNTKKEFQREDYLLALNKDYNLNFKIRNNSKREFSNLQLSISGSEDDEAEFKTIEMRSAKTETRQIPAGKIESLAIPKLPENSSINFNLLFKPKKASLSYFEIKIKENQTKIFSETIWVGIKQGEEIKIIIEPEEIQAFTEKQITITALAKGAEPVQNAEIIMTRILADNSRTMQKAKTSAQGKAMFTLPASSPGTKIVFEAQKDDYYSEPVEKTIENTVIEIKPETLESEIDTKINLEEILQAEISNRIGTALEIFSVSLSIDSKMLLDTRTMNDFFGSIKGTRIEALETKKIAIIKTRATEGTELEQNETLQGEILLTMTEPKTSLKFDKKISIQIKIKAISDVSMGCIKISKQEWLDYTKNNSATLELELENNCIETGTAELRLVGKTIWEEQATGIIEIVETSALEENSEVLGENNWRTLKKSFGRGEKMIALLVFTPKQNTLGKTAQFKIMFDAQAQTEHGIKYVGSSGINAKIDIANTEQCLNTDKEKLEIKKEANSTEFTIDASKCLVPLQIALCRNDEGCKGEASEGKINLSSKNISLDSSRSKTKTIVSKGTIAGIYGINIEAKTPNSDWVYIKTIDVFIEPSADSIFTLDKYEFSMIGNSSKDSATVFNPNLAENIEVIAPVQAWHDSIQNTDSFFDPEIAGTGATHLELANAKIAADLAKQRMQEMAETASSEADKATQLSDAAKKLLDNAEQQAEQADQMAQQVLGQAQQLASLAEMLVVQGQTVSAAAAAGTTNPITATVCTDATAAAIKMNKALMAAKLGSMAASTGAQVASQATGQGKNNCQQGKNLGDQGLQNATDAQKGPCKTNSISDRAGEGSEQVKQAAEDMLNAAEQDKQCGQQMQNAGQKFAKVGADVAGVGTQIAIMEALSPTIMKCPTASAPMIAFKAQTYAFKALQIGLSGASYAAQNQAQAAQGAANTANAASMAANSQNEIAEDNLNRLSVVELNSQKASEYGNGRTIGILGSYLGLGAMIGNYDGNAYNASLENCPDGFQSILPDFITNLKEDKSDIVIDSAISSKIGAGWNVEEAKIFGEYESQTAGIWFENKGIESEKPVFATTKIFAYKHKHKNPTIIESESYAGAGTEGAGANGTFGPFNVPDEIEPELAEQKFHLKFITKEKKTMPATESDNACLQGALFGATGEKALPKIKLSWSWHDDTGISENSCLQENPKAVYCDAAQFSIMASKRLKALQEFIEKNSNIGCPTNQAIENLKWLVEKWNTEYLVKIGKPTIPENLQELNPECWMPKTTFLFDNKPAISYFVEEASKKNAVNWTSKIKSTAELEKIFWFNSLLIKDGYSQNFQKDFVDYYNNIVLLNAPEWFLRNPMGKFSDYFSTEQKLGFSQKFLDSTELPNAGSFESFFNIDFGEKWRFFNEAKQPSAKIAIELDFKKEPENGSIFYYLPFDAGIGTGQNRQGYGIGYSNEEKEFLVTTQDNVLVSTKQTGNGLSSLSTKTIEDTKTTNSSFAKRGMLLEISQNENEKQLAFYPSYATPLLMKISSEQNQGKFSAFFQLLEADKPKKTAENLAFWTGAAQCTSFNGEALQKTFDSAPDRYAEELDKRENPANAYALDFENLGEAKQVLLRTIFFAPTGKPFTLNSVEEENNLQKTSIGFLSPDTGFQPSIEITGISTMLHNNRRAQDSTVDLQGLLDLAKNQSACITDSQNKTLFWWNQEKLLQAQGSENSILMAETQAECS